MSIKELVMEQIGFYDEKSLCNLATAHSGTIAMIKNLKEFKRNNETNLKDWEIENAISSIAEELVKCDECDKCKCGYCDNSCECGIE